MTNTAPITPPTTFPAAYARICEVTGTRTQTEVAEVLDIRQSSISDAKRRKSIPAEWLLKLLRIYSVNPDWIETGQGAQYLVGIDNVPENNVYAINEKHLEMVIGKILSRATLEVADEVRALLAGKKGEGA